MISLQLCVSNASHRVARCTALEMTENHGVGGSIPPLGTKIFKDLADKR